MVSSAPDTAASLAFESSARRDVRWWLLLIVGLVFALVGGSIDPANNCDANGQCAPWLVPIAVGFGVLALCGAAFMLMTNPKRGCRIDPATGTLHWWQWQRGPQHSADTGGVAITDIQRIRVVNTSDSDHIYFYGADGLLPLPDSECFPWPYQDWARRLVAAYPHVDLTVVGG
jgi:hypothetical protein